MKVDRLTPTDYQLDIEAEELAALMAAARCALEPGCTELNPATQVIVEKLVSEYDVQATGVHGQRERPSTLRLDPPADDVYGRVHYDAF